MDDENRHSENTLLYWLFLAGGVILILLSFFLRPVTQASLIVDLMLNVGATLISDFRLSFFNFQFSICEMRVEKNGRTTKKDGSK